MILLNKKRIILFVIIIFLSIIVYFMYSNKSDASETITVSNIDINKKTVILDAGHRHSR